MLLNKIIGLIVIIAFLITCIHTLRKESKSDQDSLIHVYITNSTSFTATATVVLQYAISYRYILTI